MCLVVGRSVVWFSRSAYRSAVIFIKFVKKSSLPGLGMESNLITETDHTGESSQGRTEPPARVGRLQRSVGLCGGRLPVCGAVQW